MKIQQIIPFFALLAITATGFAESFVLENQTNYPDQDKKSKISLQWASSAKEVDENNKLMLHEGKVHPDTLQPLAQSGKIEVTIPEKAQYFRVVAWEPGKSDPDFVTNWIDIVPDKTYTLETDHLVPVVLMAGSGC
jgi:hypothetical protein